MPKTQASPPSSAPARQAGTTRRIQARRSGVHGKGVFALQEMAEGETLIEYTGEVISWPEALERHPHDPAQPNHTFYFHLDDGQVIDANVGGNSSRWINHSCAPNCLADEENGRVFIKALRNIAAGEELFYDYGLMIDARYTKKLLADYPCWCGAENCRGTLLTPKPRKRAASHFLAACGAEESAGRALTTGRTPPQEPPATKRKTGKTNGTKPRLLPQPV